MKVSFNKAYFILFMLLFCIETLIALYLKNGFIRHTFGDFLVVILLYCFLKSFWNVKPATVALTVLLISFLIEFLQLANLLEFLNLENNNLAKTIFGSTFNVTDLIAYTLGIATVLLIEIKTKKL